MTKLVLPCGSVVLYGEAVGAGPPTVLLHAGAERRDVWRPVAKGAEAMPESCPVQRRSCLGGARQGYIVAACDTQQHWEVPPPANPHDRVQSGRFLRALLLRCFVLSLVLWVLIALVTDLPTWWLVLGGATLLVLAADVLWLSYRVRRDERRATPQ